MKRKQPTPNAGQPTDLEALESKVSDLEAQIEDLQDRLDGAEASRDEARSLQQAAEEALKEREDLDKVRERGEAEDARELCDHLSTLAGRRLFDVGDCLEWLQDAARRKLWQELHPAALPVPALQAAPAALPAQATAPAIPEAAQAAPEAFGGLRLVYSAPRVPGLRQVPLTAAQKPPARKGKGKAGKPAGQAPAARPKKAAPPAQVQAAEDWDW